MTDKVYVQDKDGQPLMPTKPARARRKLDQGKAEVVQRDPFTIRLTYEVDGEKNTEEIRIGLDEGSKKGGASAVQNGGEVLYQSEVQLRTDIRSKMDRRRRYRRSRRSRKTRYRKPKFDNRRREEGWLPPSLKSKAESMVKAVKDISEILPIEGVNVEIAPFDMQKVKDPDIEGEEYQNGELKGHTSARQYVLYRDKHQCINCKKDDVPLQTHHIQPKREGGTDKPSNMVSLCVECHEGVHSGEVELSERSLKYWTNKEYKYASHVNSMKDYIVDELKKLFDDVKVTFGNITKAVRKKLGLGKSDVNDSIAVASQDFIDKDSVSTLGYTFVKKCLPRGRYRLHKGEGSEVSIPTDDSDYFGFNRWDKVELPDGTVGFVKGRRKSGYFDISDIDGNSYDHSIRYSKLELISRADTIITEVRGNSSPQ